VVEVRFGKDKIKTILYTLKESRLKGAEPDYELRDFVNDRHVKVNHKTRTVMIDTIGAQSEWFDFDKWKRTNITRTIVSYTCYKYIGPSPSKSDSMEIASPDFWFSSDLYYSPPTGYLVRHKLPVNSSNNFLFLGLEFSDSLFGTPFNTRMEAVTVNPEIIGDNMFSWPQSYSVVYGKIPDVEVKVESLRLEEMKEEPEPPPPPAPPPRKR
jgi:hypothetical protein